MNKNLIIITLIVVLHCGIFILSSQESKQADNEINEQKNQYHIKGTIYNIDNGRILVGEELASEGYTGNFEDIEGQAVWFSIGDETEIKYNNETQSFDNLEIGMQVEVFTSNPEQGSADSVIIENHPEKKCYIGGCSGEICSDQADIASTCELLPGMECLKKGTSCKPINNECTWVLSQNAAQCFIQVENKYGEEVRNSRIGYLFDKARQLIK
jgi:eight-cysteine-cluster-containing protein